MNILVANISILPKVQQQLRSYTLLFGGATQDTIEACQTNESIAKAFAAYKKLQESGGIHKAIALVSTEVCNDSVEWAGNKTTLQYYSEVIHNLWPQAELLPIYIASKEPEDLLKELVAHFSTNDCIYIDAAGGRRTDINIILQTAKIMQYVGVEAEMSLYADIQSTNNFIRDTSEFTEIENLSAALSEFMFTGRADLLSNISNPTTSEEWKTLFEAMQKFSDCISIGDVDNLDTILESVQDAVARCKKVDAIDVSSVIIQRFLPIFEERIIGKGTQVDYLQVIQWCVDNKMVQQALTIIVEKLPKYLIDNKYFYPRTIDKKQAIEEEANKDSMFHGNWEAYALYKCLLSSLSAQSPLVEELKRAIQNREKPGKQSPEVCKALITLRAFNNPRWECKKVSMPGKKELENFIEKQNINKYDSLLNSVLNNDTVLNALLDLKKETKKETITNKLEAIARIQQSGAPQQFKYHENLNWQYFEKVLYAYVYVKAVRNQINHASSEENLTEADKQVLLSQGLDCNTHSLSTICENIKFLIENVKDSIKKEEIISAPIIEKTEYNGNAGDEISALCHKAGYVTIEGLNYEVQMFVNRAVDKQSLIGKVVKVKAEQFRKGTKILSAVRYINPNPSIDLGEIKI